MSGRGHGDQQAAGGLGVEAQVHHGLVDALLDREVVGRRIRGSARSPRARRPPAGPPAPRRRPAARRRRPRPSRPRAAPSRPGGRTGRSPSRRCRPRRPPRCIASAAALFSVGHRPLGSGRAVAARPPDLAAEAQHARAQRLGQHQHVADARRVSCETAAPPSTAPVMAKPSLISSSLMLWPPISATPASAQRLHRARRASRYMISPVERLGRESQDATAPSAASPPMA